MSGSISAANILPSGTRFCNPHAEIAGARADIGDNRSALQMQGVQNLLRLLPGVAFRIIELFGPFLRIFESMMEGPVGWTVHLMARPRVLRGHFGPRLSRGVPSRSPTPHHGKNGHRREHFGFHFLAFPWNWDGRARNPEGQVERSGANEGRGQRLRKRMSAILPESHTHAERELSRGDRIVLAPFG
jgi:hypothetical protein